MKTPVAEGVTRVRVAVGERTGGATSVHVVVLVFFLPLAVAGFADPDPTFAHFVAAGAPHVDGIVHREGASTVRFVGKVLAAFDAAGDLALFLRGLGFGVLFAGVLAVLSRLGFESHAKGSLAPFIKVRSLKVLVLTNLIEQAVDETQQSTEGDFGDVGNGADLGLGSGRAGRRGRLVDEGCCDPHRFLALPNVVVGLDGVPELVKGGADGRFEAKVGHELVKVLVGRRDLVHVQASRNLANQAREVLLRDVEGLGDLGDLSGQAFLASHEVGAGGRHTGDGTTGDEAFSGQATVEASGLFLEGCWQSRAVADELVGFDEVALTALAGLGALVDHAPTAPIPASLRTHAVA